METNKLYEALEKKALNAERSKIQTAILNFQQSLRHPNGSSFTGGSKITIAAKHGDKDIEIDISSTTFLSALQKQLLSERKSTLIDKEIRNFMQSQENYAAQINEIQQYLDQ